MPGSNAPGGRREFIGVFGVDAALKRMPLERYVFLPETQFFAGRNANLLLHNVNAGNHFRDRMLHLHPGVHFNKEKFPILKQEFEGACTAVANLAAGLCATFAYLVAQACVECRCRRFLNNFLVAALHRAIAFAQIHSIAVGIGQHLEFNVARILQKFFHVYHGIIKRCLGFGTGHGHRVEQRRFGMHYAHAAPATAARSLDNNRVTNRAGDLDYFRRIFRQSAIHAGHTWDTGFFHRLFGGDLVAHQAYGFGSRTNEHEAAFFDTLGKVGIL